MVSSEYSCLATGIVKELCRVWTFVYVGRLCFQSQRGWVRIERDRTEAYSKLITVESGWSFCRMGINTPLEEQVPGELSNLAEDGRWQLVQRIVESRGFERASQLRKILLYVSRSAILFPNRVLREYDIACDVLERRKDFDPGTDNIVRSQFTHLRRKLELYFLDEGKAEALTLKIPKGSYLPHFALAKVLAEPKVPTVNAAETEQQETNRTTAPPLAQLPVVVRPWWRRGIPLTAALCLLPSLVLSVLLFRASTDKQFFVEPPRQGNAFVQFLSKSEAPVMVVLPDLTLVLLENFLKIEDVPVSDYVRGTYLQNIASVKDATLQQQLLSLSVARLTTYNEALVASELIATMSKAGVHTTTRYARDLHVGDLSDGSSVLIGGPGSNPWASLFMDQLNFRFSDQRATDTYYFENRRPEPGEQAKYPVTYPYQGKQPAIGYVNVALTQNPAHSGYTLLIFGADQQEAESATRFLLRGQLPAEITALLSRKDLRYFEIFLRGTHIVGEADSTFEVVAIRPQPAK